MKGHIKPPKKSRFICPLCKKMHFFRLHTQKTDIFSRKSSHFLHKNLDFYKKALYLQRSNTNCVTKTPPACGFFCDHLTKELESRTPTDAVAVMPARFSQLGPEHPYRSLLFNVQNLIVMNQFEEEIARLNEERSEKIAPIQERIDKLTVQVHNMKELCKLNSSQILELQQQKTAIKEEYSQKKQRLYEESKDYYSINMSANKLRFLLRGFMAEHDDVNEAWNAYVSANFPAAQEAELVEVEGGAA